MAQDPRPQSRALLCLEEILPSSPPMNFALGVLRALELRPVVLHVRPSDAAPEIEMSLLEEVDRALASDKGEFRQAQGSVEAEILKELERQPYELLVLGLSERPADQPPSPLSQRLARQVAANVLLVQNPPETIERLLICTGGMPASVTAVRWGIRLARATEARATVLYVASKAPSMYSGLPAIEEGLSEVLARDTPLASHLKDMAAMADSAGVQAGLELRHGIVAEEILRACEMRSYDLVILGAPQPGSLVDRLLLGEVGPQVLGSMHRSTMIVRDDSNNEPG